MKNKRLITKSWLTNHHFKYDKERNLYYNSFTWPGSYDSESVKYDYDNRVLYTQKYHVIGGEKIYEMNEADAYKWLRDYGYLFYRY